MSKKQSADTINKTEKPNRFTRLFEPKNKPEEKPKNKPEEKQKNKSVGIEMPARFKKSHLEASKKKDKLQEPEIVTNESTIDEPEIVIDETDIVADTNNTNNTILNKLMKLEKKRKNVPEPEPIEEIEMTDEELYEKCGYNKYLNSTWTVWVHRNDCQSWTEDSYQFLHTINSIGTFWEFFNNFHKLNKEENNFFIMRDKIKPIWEDNNNRNGGIESIKMDCYDKNSSIDIGCEAMICFCFLIMNETFISNGSNINGISYSIKNRSVLIKIWCKDNIDIGNELPKSLINKLNITMKNNTHHKKSENYINPRFSKITPEYEQ
jgi:hypothetical protein